jgi:hypothetical protein
MKCEEVMEWMQRDLDSDLNDLEKKRLNAHLDNCHTCTQMYHRLQRLSLGLEQLPKVEPAYSLVDAILPRIQTLGTERQEVSTSPSQIREIKNEPSEKMGRKRWNARRWGGWVAAGIVLMLGVYTLADRGIYVSEGNMTESAAKSSDMAKIATNSGASENSVKAEKSKQDSLAMENKDSAQEYGLAMESPQSADEPNSITKESMEPNQTMGIAATGENLAENRLPSSDGQWVGVIRDQTVYIENSQGEVAYSSTQLRKASDQLTLQKWSEDSHTLHYVVVDEMGRTTEWEIRIDGWTEQQVSR